MANIDEKEGEESGSKRWKKFRERGQQHLVSPQKTEAQKIKKKLCFPF